MSQSPAILKTLSEATLILTINDPDRRNPLTEQAIQGLRDALDIAAQDPSVRAVVITGAEGNFSSGGDLKSPRTSPKQLRGRLDQVRILSELILSAPVPIIAAVEGWAVGAGFSLALLCDTIVASRTASFLAAFPRVGLIPDWGMLDSLPARVGSARARQIMLYAQPVTADAGLSIGLVDRLADPGDALATSIEISTQLQSLSPEAVRLIKAYKPDLVDSALRFERIVQPTLAFGHDGLEGIKAFAENRKPKFENVQ